MAEARSDRQRWVFVCASMSPQTEGLIDATKPAKEGSSDSDAEDTPRKSKNKRKKRDISAVPAWQRTDKLTR